MSAGGALVPAARCGWAMTMAAALQCGAQALPQPVVAAPAPVPYQDQVLDSGPMPDLTLDPEFRSYNRSGWPRGGRIDYSLAHDSAVTSATTQGLAAFLFLDTPDYGTLSLDTALGTVRNENLGIDRQRTLRWRIDQRALPLEGGWLASHAAGDISTPQVPLSFAANRIYLPSSPMQGLSLQWQRAQSTLFNASAGRFGLFNGQTNSGFDTLRGSVASLGVQQRLGAAHQLATQYVQATDVPDSGFGLTGRSTRSVWSAWSWEGIAPWSEALAKGAAPASERTGGLRLQANLLRSASREEATGSSDSAGGYWLDARWRTAATQQEAGAFRFDPDLRWGAYIPAADLQGIYWRGGVASRQWQLDSSAEYAQSITGRIEASNFFAVSGRYRVDVRNSVGAQTALRTGNGAGRSLQLSWNRAGEWGQTQWRAETASARDTRIDRLSVDQQWLVRGARALGTSLSWERERDLMADRRILGWGVLGSQSLGNDLTIDASIRGASGAEKQLNANIGAFWRLRAGWSLLGQYSVARGQDRLAPLLVSALAEAATPVQAQAQSSRRILLTLRYEGSAGSAQSPIGGSPGSGAGRIHGTVYFDADASGTREASEGGVPGVTVLLNRRFATRTDALGRYEFPAVAAGEHTIELTADNVPLPWSPTVREAVRVRVQVREKTDFDFAVQRER